MKREKKEIVIAENRNFEGIWIPRKLYVTNKFNPRLKFFLVEVKSLSKHGYCYATDKHFSDFLGISERMVQNMIKELKEQKYLKTEYEYEKDTKAIKRRFLILTKKFYDEFYNEAEEKCIEENFSTPTEENFNDCMEENFDTGTEINYGEKYNNNSSSTLNTNNENSSVTDKHAFPPKGEKEDSHIYASFPEEKEEPIPRKESRYIPDDYTEQQLIEHIKPVIDNRIEEEYTETDNPTVPYTIMPIIVEFYREYEDRLHKKHRILSDKAYENIVDRYMMPPDAMIESDARDFETYRKMIERYFEVDYNKRGNYIWDVELSISHFMSDEIRANLYMQTCL